MALMDKGGAGVSVLATAESLLKYSAPSRTVTSIDLVFLEISRSRGVVVFGCGFGR